MEKSRTSDTNNIEIPMPDAQKATACILQAVKTYFSCPTDKGREVLPVTTNTDLLVQFRGIFHIFRSMRRHLAFMMRSFSRRQSSLSFMAFMWRRWRHFTSLMFVATRRFGRFRRFGAAPIMMWRLVVMHGWRCYRTGRPYRTRSGQYTLQYYAETYKQS